MINDFEDKAMEELRKKEATSNLKYDPDPDVDNVKIPDWIPPAGPQKGEIPTETPRSLGRAASVPLREPIGMDEYWKKLPLENLPSVGFGYPEGMEIAIRPAEVAEIKYYSTVDENDRIDLDDKLNNILQKCCKVRWNGGALHHYDIHYEDRFYIIMAIRDYTFIQGENRIILPVQKDCQNKECDIPDTLELKSSLLDSFKLSSEIKSKYDHEEMCFVLNPKGGGEGLKLYIPSIGVTTLIRKIIEEKRKKNKKFDESFSEVSPFIIPNWRDLDERLYDSYERSSKEWDITQFSIADQASRLIKFSLKADIRFPCKKCGVEVTAPVIFPGGYRSIFIISDILRQLL